MSSPVVTLPAPTPQQLVTAIHGPYEDLAIKALDVLQTIIDSQPKDVQADLWRMYVQDMKDWREFWKAIGVKVGTL